LFGSARSVYSLFESFQYPRFSKDTSVVVDYQTTRVRILLTIREAGGCTVGVLRQQTGLSNSALRQHLALMEREGLVRRGLLRGRAGRPPFVYSCVPAEDEPAQKG
jgi:predicted ArsR family transcriptional regulator